MRPFHFSLEKVHNYRQAVEEHRKRELASARLRQEEEERRLRVYVEEREAFQDRWAGGPEEASLGEFWQRDLYLQILNARIDGQAERVIRAAAAVKECQDLVREAMRERKVLDRLKARKQAVYNYTAAREEQKQLDDVAVVAFNRRGAEN
ncbi:MAG: flagellar export protein FliJ [Thermoanaerobacteraceae bacterium]|nr:flagellar export protein FliJ [Thermoanaerobacteraceae bacterium]